MKFPAIALGLALCATSAAAEPAVVASGSYPEGLLWHGGKLYFTAANVDDVGWEEQWSGRDGILEHYEELLGAFPDMDIKYERRHITDEYVILEVTVTGTQTGHWREVPPLGRKMRSRVCALYTFDEEGLLNMERTYYDKAIILEQLGMFQDPRRPLGRVMAVITPPFSVVRAYLRRLFRKG